LIAWIAFGGWFLAVVFGLAAWSKIGQPGTTDETLRSFGVPHTWSHAGATWLPGIEAGVLLLLLLPYAPALGLMLAGGMLAVFTFAMSLQLLKGNKPSCNCFGQTRSQPISWMTVARNLLLLGLAVGLWHSELAAQGVIGMTGLALATGQALQLLVLALTVGMFTLTWLLMSLTRQQGRLLLKLDHMELRLSALGLEPAADPGQALLASSQPLHIGQTAPPFSALTVAGSIRSLDDYLAQSGTQLLVFVGPACAPCHEMMREIPAWQRQDGQHIHWLTISAGTAESNRSAFPTLAPERVVLQAGQDVNTLFGVVATPSAVWIGGDGRILSHLAVGRDAIRSLYEAPVLTQESADVLPLASGST
jgi:Methylamine utilisation protein MauE